MDLPPGISQNTVLIAIHTKGMYDNGSNLVEMGFAWLRMSRRATSSYPWPQWFELAPIHSSRPFP